MLRVRKSSERGHADHGWLDSRHSFSFADYYDEAHMGFGPLRVINEDRIQGGRGFGTHPHRDMEIISYVMDGALEHRDTMGNRTVIRPGEVQRMSAGTGVMHSEMNAETDRITHFLQIWIMPKTKGITPSYAQKSFADALTREPLVLVASGDGRLDSIAIHQDADLYLGRLKSQGALRFSVRPQRGLWLQILRGSAHAQGVSLDAGDGASLVDGGELELSTTEGVEFLLFDLPIS